MMKNTMLRRGSKFYYKSFPYLFYKVVRVYKIDGNLMLVDLDVYSAKDGKRIYPINKTWFGRSNSSIVILNNGASLE